jgi:NACHT domain
MTTAHTSIANEGISLLSNPGWIVAAALFILLIMRDLVKKWTTQAVEKVAQIGYNWLAASLLQRRALRRYRTKVIEKYGRIVIPFAENRAVPVDRVYVPLQAVSADEDVTPRDAYASLRAQTRTVVTGPPGSGKSMLLKHSLLVWALSPSKTIDPIRVPALIELHRFNGNSIPMREHIVAQFERDGLPGAERFVHRMLVEGKLALLLDGLDEVATSERSRVVQIIKDFAETHSQCQIVITCRAAIYEGQLQPQIMAAYRIAEFDEQLIRLFLRNWPNIPTGSVDQLLSALRSTPRLMQLARNPLLLTMIAYLYSDVYDGKEQMLPRSRTEFYGEVTDVLLRRLKSSINQYPAPVKKTVLQRLAFVGLDQHAEKTDRLSIPYQRVITEIARLLPRLNLDNSHAERFLQEIVERSGLLLAIDGGERFQFAHLTLQEYLAATYLATEPSELLARYRKDPGAWREPVKLWCGEVSRDSAALIRPIFGEDQVLAFECLADAQNVDGTLADEITAYFRARLNGTRQGGHAIATAFGIVAADRRPRGRKIFDFLTKIAQTTGDPRLPTAVEALGTSTLPEAASVLAYAAVNAGLSDQESALVRKALVAMGEVALPPLLQQISDGVRLSVEDVAAIGTPLAAQALCELLWSDAPTASLAAWHAAGLMRNPEVEDALSRVSPPASAATSPSETWVWDPFRSDRTPNLTAFAGRIAFLLKYQPPPVAGSTRRSAADPRLTIPLCGTALGQAFSRGSDRLYVKSELRGRIDKLPVLIRPRIFPRVHPERMRRQEWLTALEDTVNLRQDAGPYEAEISSIGTALLASAALPEAYYTLLRDISPVTVAILIKRISTRPSAFTRRAWQRLAKASIQASKKSNRRFLAPVLSVASFSLALYVSSLIATGYYHLAPRWAGLVMIVWIAMSIAAPAVLRARFSLGIFQSWLSGPLAKIRGSTLIRRLLRLIACGQLLATGVLIIAAVNYLAWFETVLVVIAYLLLWRIARYSSRVRANPFARLLDIEAQASRNRTSVIARPG